MANATVAAELATIWTTYFLANYGDATTLGNAVDLTTWTYKPTSDPVANLLAITFLGVRKPGTIGWNVVMTDPEKKTLYDELAASLNSSIDAIDGVYTPLNAAYGDM